MSDAAALPNFDNGFELLRNPLKRLAKQVIRLWPEPVLARRRGARFILHPRNWIDNRLLAGVPFEDEQISAAQALIREQHIDLVIDIGANIGLYSILLGRMPEIKNVIAFEPVRRNYAQILGNVFLNGLADKVEVHRTALGSSADETVIFVDPTSTGVSRLDLADAHRDKAKFSDQESVAVARFDDVCDLNDRRAFVKIDVEGRAVDVLEGMATFLERNTVVIQVETSDNEEDGVLKFLSGKGFSIVSRIAADCYFLRK